MKRAKYIEWLYSELPSLIKDHVISGDVSQNIKNYYGSIEKKSKASIILGIFGLLGSILIGLGIILLFAYNWDKLSRLYRTVLCFIPLVISSLLVFWAVSKDKKSSAIREGVAAFNMLSVGATIALISQTYNILGNLGTFILTWMLISVPIVYILSASFPAILYLIGITYWATISQNIGSHAVLYWPLSAIIIPHVITTLSQGSTSIRSTWLSWIFCICFTVGIGISLEKVMPGIWILIYSSFFAALYLIGIYKFEDSSSSWMKPFRSYGIFGISVLAYILTYEWAWRDIGWRYYRIGDKFHGWAAICDYLIGLAFLFLATYYVVRSFKIKDHFSAIFGSLPIISIIGYSLASSGNVEGATIIFVIYVLILGLACLLAGINEKMLGLMNAGLLILAVLIGSKFITGFMGILQQASFFIILGILFLTANVILSKRIRKEAE